MITSTLSRADVELRDRVLKELEFEPSVDAHDVGVAAEEGVVTLTGVVENYSHKMAAERAAKRVFGVRGLANDIQVKLGFEVSDPDLVRDALQALRARVSVPPGITVTAKNGYLTLEGEVSWMYQRMAAESALRHLRGVCGLDNRIALRPEVTTSDVKHKIEAALRRSAEVDARRIAVDVHGSTVTLSGSVRSWVEKEDAERAAWAAAGVTRVDSRLVVKF